jgi:two-component system, LytTR family, response regulator
MTHFFVRQGRAYERVEVAEIRYLESSKNYCKIWLAQRYVFVPLSLKQMETQLPATEFIRIHRAYIISLRHLRSFNYEKVWVDGKELPIGEGRVAELKQVVSILKVQSTGREKEAEKV